MWAVYSIIAVISFLVASIIGMYMFAQYQRNRELQFAQALDPSTTSHDPLLTDLDPTQPALLYFTSPMCTPCQTMQRPAITRLQELMPDLPVITIDIMENQEIAKRWHVMSLPRTFIIGKNRQVSATNLDVASTELLHTQIKSAMAQTSTTVQVAKPTKKGLRIPKLTLARPQE